MVYYCLSQIEEVRECTGHASAQIENFLESLIQISGHLHVRELKNKGKYSQVSNSQMWSWSLRGVVA